MLKNKSEAERLEKTVDALGKSIENKSATGSSIRITNWIKTLKAHHGLQAIVHDLENLKEAIAAKDGVKVYTLLGTLGAATVTASEKAKTNESGPVKKLGETLLKASQFVKKLVGEKTK